MPERDLVPLAPFAPAPNTFLLYTSPKFPYRTAAEMLQASGPTGKINIATADASVKLLIENFSANSPNKLTPIV